MHFKPKLLQRPSVRLQSATPIQTEPSDEGGEKQDRK